MSLIFAVTNQSEVLESLSRYFSFCHRQSIQVRNTPYRPDNVGNEWVTYAFREVADWLEELVQSRGGDAALRDALGFVDLEGASLDDLDPILKSARGELWPRAVALLVLAFPEVHWVLLPGRPAAECNALLRAAHIFYGPGSETAESIRTIWQLHSEGYSPLLDAAGLRDKIRSRIHGTAYGKTLSKAPEETTYLPLRQEVAAAADDESAYAYFNAYAAYRFGFRAAAVTSEALMDRLFKIDGQDGEVGSLCGKEIYLTFEDLFLHFPDRSNEKMHPSLLEDRDARWSRLERARLRIFATVGHTKGADPKKRDRDEVNQKYLENWRAAALPGQLRWSELVYKPFSGLFDLWKRSGLHRMFGSRKGTGYPPWFKWPIQDAMDKNPGDHSSTGRLHELADRLIARASRILEKVQTVPDAIHGATLATDALEYLGHRTPTTSLAALTLKHQLEVTAECMFYGMTYNLAVDPRLDEIDREVRSIGSWFRPKTRRLSELSAFLKVVNELLRQFRKHNQFDEEMVCLTRSRDLQLRLWLRRNPFTNLPMGIFRWYIHSMLRSIGIFFLAILAWIIVLGLLFSYFGVATSICQGLGFAVVSFFGIQSPIALETLYGLGPGAIFAVLAAVLGGFFNLGIFVSHLYLLMSRR